MGYTQLLQFTLIGKLIFFFMVIGMNSRLEYRYGVLCFCVSYYFYQVRDMFLTHYQR